MKASRRSLLSLLSILILFCFLFSGCAGEDTCPTDNSGKIHLSLRYSVESMSSHSPLTRSAADSGSELDRRVNPGDITLMTFDADGNIIDMLRSGEDSPFSTQEGGNLLLTDEGLTANLIDERYHREFTIVLLANWKGYVEPTVTVRDYDDILNLDFSIPADQRGIEYLPMYAEKRCGGSAGGDLDIGDIALTRRVAKIEVVNSLEGHSVNGATLGRWNANGKVGADEVGAPASWETGLALVPENDGKTWYGYTAAAPLGDDEAEERHITVNVDNSEEYELWIKDYTSDGSGDFQTLRGNWLYTFNITTLSEPTPPALEIHDEVWVLTHPADMYPENGKFSNENLFLFKEGDLDELQMSGQGFSFAGDQIYNQYYWVLKPKDYNVAIEDIRFEISENHNSNGYKFSIPLLKSAYRISNEIIDKGKSTEREVTFIMLTGNESPQDVYSRKLRIYWNPNLGERNLEVQIYYYPSYDYEAIILTGTLNERGYYYSDIQLKPGTIDASIYLDGSLYDVEGFTIDDLFVERLGPDGSYDENGEVYWAFYID